MPKTPVQILAVCDDLCMRPEIQYDLDAYMIANAARRIALERVIMTIGDVLSVNDSLFLSSNISCSLFGCGRQNWQKKEAGAG